MGVTMSNQNLDSIDLLKEMELARQCLFDYAKMRKILLLEKLKSPGRPKTMKNLKRLTSYGFNPKRKRDRKKENKREKRKK